MTYNQNIPPLLTATEVADQLQVTTATVRNLIRAGQLPAIKLPGRRGVYRIPATALNALVQDCQTPIEVRGDRNRDES